MDGSRLHSTARHRGRPDRFESRPRRPDDRRLVTDERERSLPTSARPTPADARPLDPPPRLPPMPSPGLVASIDDGDVIFSMDPVRTGHDLPPRTARELGVGDDAGAGAAAAAAAAAALTLALVAPDLHRSTPKGSRSSRRKDDMSPPDHHPSTLGLPPSHRGRLSALDSTRPLDSHGHLSRAQWADYLRFIPRPHPLDPGPDLYPQVPTQLATPVQPATPEAEAEATMRFEASMSQLTAIIRQLEHREEDPSSSKKDARSTATGHSPPSAHVVGSDDGPGHVPIITTPAHLPPSPAPPWTDVREPAAVATALRRLIPHLDAVKSQVAAYPQLVTALQLHAKRLESLENASVSNAPLEDVSDRIDLVDGRLTEIEGKVDDLDRWRLAMDQDGPTRQWSGERRARRGDDKAPRTASSFRSDGSNGTKVSASSALAAAVDGRDLDSLLATVERRLARVEGTTPPSVNRPWQVEVILLPWGRHLAGIWESTDAPGTDPATAPSQWTQSRELAAGSRTSSFDQDDPVDTGWTDPSIRRWAEDAHHWKLARACGTRSRVYRRLRSAGLIREVEITGGSAMDVHHAVLHACGDVLKRLNRAGSPALDHSARSIESGRPMGLQAPFIPLRKVHRDSRLQFLTPAEMVTSTLWNVEFLSSSVVMKAVNGRRRLFITHRDGYLQPKYTGGGGGGGGTDVGGLEWTWPRLRELPRTRHRPSTPVSTEACWEWDPRLDQPSGHHSSFLDHEPRPRSKREAPRRPSQAEEEVVVVVDRPIRSRSLSPTFEGRRVLPASPMSNLPVQSRSQKRESLVTVEIHGEGSGSSPRRGEHAKWVGKPTLKRRRISRSPTGELSGSAGIVNWTATPRRSPAPASPFFSEIVSGEGRSQATGGFSNVTVNHKGGGTPFAYATPHSGPVMNSVVNAGDGSKKDLVGHDHHYSLHSHHHQYQHHPDHHHHQQQPQQQQQKQQHHDDETWEGVGGEDDDMVMDTDEGVVQVEVHDEDDDDNDEEEDSDGDETTVLNRYEEDS